MIMPNPTLPGGSALMTTPRPPARILLVDDDQDVRRVCADVLAHNGYGVDADDDGEAGWAALQTSHYDLLITDHQMPHLTGLELVSKVFHSGMRIEIIMASGAWSSRDLREQASFYKVHALPKPFSPQELLTTVRQVLEESRAANVPGDSVPSV
jgi:DNA-binding response OmpR family regulator